ncbi:hypothetical protein SASPL_128578 [Salvia splendens]|uniref:WAT1-related protein n=1 Tax=Salvia splendens TaxID=180675 RepID=A0A8X8ZMM3_SALSN|nr:hypothetical protein SASPL_128578 [Salvia splendens]
MGLENYKAIIVMVGCQFLYAGVALTGREALLQDFSSRVFVVYRQFTAFLLIAPFAFFSRRGTNACGMTWKGFFLISLLSFIGVTFSQNLYYEGLYLSSSSAASALGNAVPAITFTIAYFLGKQMVDWLLISSCKHHLLVPLGYLAAVQSAVLTFIIEPDLNTWKLTSSLQFFCCFYAGVASALTFLGQAWCIGMRGPLFSAMFNPLCTVIVTIFAFIFMHEELYIGSLTGGLAVIIGLYVVLWGKAKDYEEIKEEDTTTKKHQNNVYGQNEAITSVDLEQPLLSDN